MLSVLQDSMPSRQAFNIDSAANQLIKHIENASMRMRRPGIVEWSVDVQRLSPGTWWHVLERVRKPAHEFDVMWATSDCGSEQFWPDLAAIAAVAWFDNFGNGHSSSRHVAINYLFPLVGFTLGCGP